MGAVTVAIASMTLTVLSAVPASAHHSWNDYRWEGEAYPLSLVYVDSLGSGFRRQSVTRDVTQDWNLSKRVALSRVRGENDRGLREECPMTAGQIRVCNADYGPSWFGDTELGVDSGRIVGGRIRINDYWGTGRGYRRFVLCHEIGHSLGLGHQDSGHSCLNGGRHPDGHDYEMLELIYDAGNPTEPPEDCYDLVCSVIDSAPARGAASAPVGRARPGMVL